MRRTALYLSILVLSLGFAMASYGDAVVDDCSAYGGAPGTDLAEALASGAAGGDPAVNEITFACSGTIVVPQINISGSVRIDGGGQNVTLSGGNSNGIFGVGNNESLSLIALILENGSFSSGGAISVGGADPQSLTLIDTTVRNSSASSSGGAIKAGQNATVLIIGSTLSGNSSQGGGGALFASNTATVTVINSTISGNASAQGPGALHALNGASIDLVNVTVTNNSSGVAGAVTSFNAAISLVNTIVANQSAGPNCSFTTGGLTSLGNNLASDNLCNLTQPSDKPNNPNANLGPLAANGGPTQTHALLPGSDALDMGNDTVCGMTLPTGADGVGQRGVTRPQFVACDIGAFELEEPPARVPGASLPALAALAALLGLGISRRAAVR